MTCQPEPQRDWRSISRDPNSAAVVEARQRLLAMARCEKPVRDCIAFLCELAAGKRVLDVGVVDHQLAACDSPDWLHGRLRAVAKECEGVDVLPEAVAALRQRGYSVRCANLAEQPLPGSFDLIVCGDVLEHIAEPGRFLSNCRRMLAPGGELVVTLPNPWYAGVLARAAAGKEVFQDNADHVAWYDPATLFELGLRCGLQLHHFAGVRVKGARTLKGRLALALLAVATKAGLRHELLAKTMIYRFRPVPAPPGMQAS